MRHGTLMGAMALAAAATLGCAAEVELLPGGFFAPGSASRHDLELGHTKLRGMTNLLLYVTEPGEVVVTIACEQVGRYKGGAKLSVLDPSGAELGQAEAAVGESASVSFAATRIGPHDVRVDGGRNGFTLAAEGARLLIPAGAGGEPFHGVSRAAPVFLFVPPGGREFAVRVGGQGAGETVKAHLLAPDGTEVAVLNTTGKMTDSATVGVPDGADDGVWAMTLERGEQGIFEDFEFTLSGDVSPYVAERPEDLLCPAMSVRSRRVSREGRDPDPSVVITLYAALADLDGATIALDVRPFEGGDALWSDTVTEAEGRSLQVGPPQRPADGKYAWSARLMQGEETVQSFEGTWWCVPAPAAITEDGTVLVNGEPFFARGLYHVEPEDYELVRAHGFNAVQCHAENVEAVRQAGLKAGVALYWRGRPNSERWREAMQSVIDSDAVFAWWIQDEPRATVPVIEMIADAYMYIRMQDPSRPAYTCLNNPSTYEELAPQTDIVSADVYPIGRGKITQIADTLDHGRDVIPKHVHYFIGQVWSWPNTRLVEPDEHRCMTYLALAHGARGLFWYSFRDANWYLPDDNPAVWAEMKRVNDELIALEPALLTGNLGQHVFAEDGGAVHTAVKRVEDRLYVIAVNPGDEAVSCAIDLELLAPGVACDDHAEVMFEDRSIQTQDGAIRAEFEPLGVHVYRLTLR